MLQSLANPLAFSYQVLTALAQGRDHRWPRVRCEHLKREPRCLACLRATDLDVHHVTPYHVDRSRELDPENLMTLCRRCHLLIGHLDRWDHWNPYARQDAANLNARIVEDRQHWDKVA